MNPVEIQISGVVSQSPHEICEEFLNLRRWPEFKGYSILPGIKKAEFEVKTPAVVGSIIRVQNTDGSSHVEKIVAWDVDNQISMRFQDFSPPLQRLASHFIETWTFRPVGGGTEVTRKMLMFPKGWLGWVVLQPISRLMKKAFVEHLAELTKEKPVG